MPIWLKPDTRRFRADSLSVSGQETSASGHFAINCIEVLGKRLRRPIGTGIAEKESGPTVFRPVIEIRTSETSDEE